jgi:hypothetical protein
VIEHFIEQTIPYDGTQLSSLWAFRNFGFQGDSIVCFRGPCRVELPQMVDLEDVRKDAPIYSNDMLHFIIEHFSLDLEKTIIRQRLLMAVIKDVVEHETGANLCRCGDDLYLGGLKLSVSIATLTPVSTMIHTGLNVSSKDTPVPAVGLADLGLVGGEVAGLGRSVCSAYAGEYRDMQMARCKVRGVK